MIKVIIWILIKKSKCNEKTIVNDENEDDHSINNKSDDSSSESDIDLNLNETGAVNKEELATAFLASFYSDRTT